MKRNGGLTFTSNGGCNSHDDALLAIKKGAVHQLMGTNRSRRREVLDSSVQVHKAVIGTLEAQLWPNERRFIIVVEQLFVGVTVRVADSDQLDG